LPQEHFTIVEVICGIYFVPTIHIKVNALKIQTAVANHFRKKSFIIVIHFACRYPSIQAFANPFPGFQ
jgi:hypothetical protein